MRRIASFAFYFVPASTAVLLALPAALTLAPWNWRYTNLTYWHFLIFGPVYLAVLAAPGYFHVWLTRQRAAGVSTRVRVWLRVSLLTAFLCSTYGTFAGYWMIWFSPPSLLAAIASARLIRLFERRHDRAYPGPRHLDPSSGNTSRGFRPGTRPSPPPTTR